MTRSPKRSLLFLASLLILSLLSGCGAATTPPPTASPTPQPTPTATPLPTWNGSADLSLWQGSNDYALEIRADGLYVQANKVTENGYIEATFPAIDISGAPFASLTALSDISANITVGLVDASGKAAWIPGTVGNQEMAHGLHPLTHSFDLARLSVDLTRITGMRIACNRGAPVCRANILLRDILLGGEAVRGLNYAPLPDVEVTLGDTPRPVTLYPLTAADADATWRAEFPSDIVKSGEFVDGQFVYTLTKTPGSGTVVLHGEKDGKTTRLAFALTVLENNPPILNEIAGQILAVDTVADLRLTGLDDGDPASAQRLTLTAESQDVAIASVERIEYDNVSRWARLKLKAAAAGTTRITVTLTDDRDASVSQTFDVAVYPEINQPPTFDSLAPIVMNTGSEVRQAITGISGGEPDDRVMLAARSDTLGLVAAVEDSVLLLRAAPGTVGTATVDITATDDGGNVRNQGNAAFTRAVSVSIIRPPITGLTDDFDGPEVDSTLAGSGEGAHTLSIEDGVLQVEIDKYATNNPWAGLWYALPSELDISANPIITLRMKAGKETAMLIFLWDANDVYNTAGTVTLLVGTEWKAYTLDFSGKNLDSEGKTVDFSRIKSLLINFAPGLLHKGTFWLDDLKVGSDAEVRAALPPLAIQAPARLTLLPGGNITELLPVSGMTDDDRVEITGADPQLFAAAEVSPQGDNLLLTLRARPNVVGTTRLKITVAGQANRQAEKYIDVLIPDRGDVTLVAVDRSTRLQTIDGFGAFLGTGVWNTARQDLTLPFVQDLGITVARFGIIDVDFEPRNDNDNPYVTDFSAFDTVALPLDWMRRLKAETAIDKFILTVWSPPAWMKKNRTQAALSISGDNFVEERYDEEYAEFLAAIVRVIKEHTDIDLYAISVQNEPQFNEPYASALLPSERMARVLNVVAARFAAEGIQTKLFMPEALPAQGGIHEYIRQLDLRPEASQGVDIIAIHNYDADGIRVGGAGAQEWSSIAKWANAARSRQVWMTETSGHADTWSGAVTLFGNIYNALVYGNASAWVWWTLAETSANAKFGLVVDNQATSRYAVSRHFYRAAQPGAVRVATTSEADILSVAFDNPDGIVTVVLYNAGKSRLVSCTGVGALTTAWVSQDGLLSRPAQVDGERVLLPSGSVATLVYSPQP